MKTHELSRYLEQLARFLRKLPDTELDPKALSGFQSFIPGIVPVHEISRKPVRKVRLNKSVSSDLEKKISNMSPMEIEKFLLSDEQAFTVSGLADLAGKIGLTSSKRQSKNALVNMIVRYYEANNMHSILRTPSGNEEQ